MNMQNGQNDNGSASGSLMNERLITSHTYMKRSSID